MKNEQSPVCTCRGGLFPVRRETRPYGMPGVREGEARDPDPINIRGTVNPETDLLGTITMRSSEFLMPDPVFCPNNCGNFHRGVRRKSNLNRHLKHECGVPKQFKCIVCFKRFSLESNLKFHYLVVHSMELM